MATRRGRGPATDAILAAVIVSLLVNDTPTDVASVGATIAFVAHRFERGSHVAPPVGLDRLRAMRRPTIVAASLLAGLLLAVAGCGGDEVTATPETVIGDLPTETSGTTEDLPALALEGDAANGETVFAAQGCGACHTLAAAGASGTIGPSLDEAKPSYELAVERVTLGLGGMPSFGDKLEAQEIADVAEYVSSSAGS
jgi:mono/diheme cytochrome c family protein